MFPLIETAIAFAAAMLAASLFVSAIVQGVQSAGNYRSDVVASMLRSVIHGFRSFYNDADVLSLDYPEAATDPQRLQAKRAQLRAIEDDFVKDVMADPALNARSGALAYGSTPEQLALLVEYIDAADLVTVARNHAESQNTATSKRKAAAAALTPPDAAASLEAVAAPAPAVAVDEITSPLAASFRAQKREDAALESLQVESPVAGGSPGAPDLQSKDEQSYLPVGWFLAARNAGSSDQELLKTLKPYATVAKFADYVERFFPVFEATASQVFKTRIRRLTLVISFTVVVLFNLDALRLMSTLYSDSGARGHALERVEHLQAQAVRLGDVVPDVQPVVDTAAKPVKVAAEAGDLLSALEEPSFGLGWQDSAIVDKWCAYTGKCSSHSMPISGSQVMHATLAWLLGLLLSCVLLSFGAPFWYKMLAGLLNLKNAVQENKLGVQGKERATT